MRSYNSLSPFMISQTLLSPYVLNSHEAQSKQAGNICYCLPSVHHDKQSHILISFCGSELFHPLVLSLKFSADAASERMDE